MDKVANKIKKTNGSYGPGHIKTLTYRQLQRGSKYKAEWNVSVPQKLDN